MVIMPAAKDAVTPVGSPAAAPIPVTPRVVWEILTKPETAQTVVLVAAEADLFEVTVMVLFAVTVPHDPPLVVKVKVAVPLYAAGGVQVAFKVVALGVKVPPATLEVQVPPVAEPPMLPPKAAEVPP
jgi:hypothetical protein